MTDIKKARWAKDAIGDDMLCFGEVQASLVELIDGTWEVWGHHGLKTLKTGLTSKEAARDWLEARAIADGYEIVREP